MPICNDCKQDKPDKDFYFSRGKPRAKCKRCVNIRYRHVWKIDRANKRSKSASWKKRNPDRARANNKASEMRHKLHHMARQANTRSISKLTSFDVWRAAKRQKLICPLTGLMLTNETISLDHIVPMSRGGANTIDNIQLIYKPINYMKSDFALHEFVQYCVLVAAQANIRKDTDLTN